MIVCGIDPGPEDGMTAAVVWDGSSVLDHLTKPTEEVIAFIDRRWPGVRRPGERSAVVIERLDSYLMRVGRAVFSAQWAAGRLYQAAGGRGHYLTRQQVKLALLGRTNAKDADVRGYLIDRFGPTRREAVGLKASPGPLYGVKGDEWQALAVAVAWWDLRGGKTP